MLYSVISAGVIAVAENQSVMPRNCASDTTASMFHRWPKESVSIRCLIAGSLDLNQRDLAFVGDGGAMRGQGELRHHRFGEAHERFRAHGIGLGDDQGDAAIAADANRLIQR